MSNFVLYLPKNSEEVKKISATDYKEEETLQDLIEEHPELLPLSSGRIITLAREYPLAGGAIDLLCADNESQIYIVETKLQRNSDRRQAIAQLIDYGAQLGKESFEDFQTKINERNRKSLEELLNEFDEESTLNVEEIRKSLHEKNFVLILAMDRFDSALKDAINYLNIDNNVKVFGIELHMHHIHDQGSVFVPEIIPPPELEITRPPNNKKPVTKEEVMRNYKNKGLESEVKHILKAFEDAEERWREVVQIKFTYKYVNLNFGNRQIELTLNEDPTRDHGVWVYNSSLYEKVFELGKQLGMNVKMSERSFAKIVIFNGEDGIRKLSSVIDQLISGLVEITTQP